MDMGIIFSSGRIYEGTSKRVETVDNVVFWGYRRGSYGLVAEFHRIRDLIGLGIVCNDTLASIMIQGHINDPSLLAS